MSFGNCSTTYEPTELGPRWPWDNGLQQQPFVHGANTVNKTFAIKQWTITSLKQLPGSRREWWWKARAVQSSRSVRLRDAWEAWEERTGGERKRYAAAHECDKPGFNTCGVGDKLTISHERAINRGLTRGSIEKRFAGRWWVLHKISLVCLSRWLSRLTLLTFLSSFCLLKSSCAVYNGSGIA